MTYCLILKNKLNISDLFKLDLDVLTLNCFYLDFRRWSRFIIDIFTPCSFISILWFIDSFCVRKINSELSYRTDGYFVYVKIWRLFSSASTVHGTSHGVRYSCQYWIHEPFLPRLNSYCKCKISSWMDSSPIRINHVKSPTPLNLSYHVSDLSSSKPKLYSFWKEWSFVGFMSSPRIVSVSMPSCVIENVHQSLRCLFWGRDIFSIRICGRFREGRRCKELHNLVASVSYPSCWYGCDFYFTKRYFKRVILSLLTNKRDLWHLVYGVRGFCDLCTWVQMLYRVLRHV